MCSTSKRSFGGDSDDDFDDSLHKRLKIRHKEPKLSTKGNGKAKHSRRRFQVCIEKVNNVSTRPSSSHNSSESSVTSPNTPVTAATSPNTSVITFTSPSTSAIAATNSSTKSKFVASPNTIASDESFSNAEDWGEYGCLLVTDQSSDLNDSCLSADQIISDILEDECNNTTVSVTDQTIATTTTESVVRLPEVPSPKKQSSLFHYFKPKGGKSISATSSTAGIIKNHSSAGVHQSNSNSVTELSKQSGVEASYSNFRKKSKRDCPFYKKIPGTCVMFPI